MKNKKVILITLLMPAMLFGFGKLKVRFLGEPLSLQPQHLQMSMVYRMHW